MAYISPLHALSFGKSAISTCSRFITSRLLSQVGPDQLLHASMRQAGSHQIFSSNYLLNSSRIFSTTSYRFASSKQADDNSNSSSDDTHKYNTLLLSVPCKNVAHVELNRPKVKNAFGTETAIEFIDVLDKLEQDSTTRCVVLSGAGPDFTSGVDIKSFMGVFAQLQDTDDIGRKAKLLHTVIEQFQAPFKRLDAFSKPVICIQHGLSYGLGMELAACSDIRYCTNDTRMAIREVLIGIAADVGSLQKMPRLVSNRSKLMELIYTGRDIAPEEALDLGFVSQVYPKKEDAIEKAIGLAQAISRISPIAITGTKRNIKFSEDKSFLIGLDYNAIWNMSMLQSEDVAKSIAAILNKSDDVEFED